MRKPALVPVGAFGVAAVALSVLAPTAGAQTTLSGTPSAGDGCTAVHIVSVPGTGSTFTGGSNETVSAMEGKVANAVVANLGDKASTWSPAYPASAGAAWSAVSEHNMADSYGHSRLLGDKAIIDHLKDYESKCPDAKIALTGFSQGAHVAGDAAALLAHGAVKGIGPDDIVGAILFADPARSGKSQYTGPEKDAKTYIPIPKDMSYQRAGEMSNLSSDTVGWTGQRSIGFDGIDGKVISICNETDMACEVERGSFKRAMSDVSDKNIGPNQDYISGPSIKSIIDSGKIATLLPTILTGGVIQSILAGDVRGGLDKADAAIDAAAMGAGEKGQLHNLIREVRAMLNLMHRDDAYGPNVSDKAIIAHLVSAGAPIAANKIPEQARPIVAALSAGLGGEAAQVPADAKARAEKIMKEASVIDASHASYFTGSQKVEGENADDWAISAMTTGIKNALDGKSSTLAAGSSPRSSSEVAEPDRADDGLRTLLETGELPPVGSTQDSDVVNGGKSTNPANNSSSATSSPTSSSTKSSSSISSSSKTSSATASPVANSGPTADTGGDVESGWVSRVVARLFA